MIIRKIEVKDSEKFLNMLKLLDCETKNMMYEPGERKTTIEEIQANIKDINSSNSITLIAEEKEKSLIVHGEYVDEYYMGKVFKGL